LFSVLKFPQNYFKSLATIISKNFIQNKITTATNAVRKVGTESFGVKIMTNILHYYIIAGIPLRHAVFIY
jgi:hypothetical protein